MLSGIVVDAAGNLFFSDERPQNVLMMPHHWVNGSNVEEKTSKKEKKEKKERKEREEEEVHTFSDSVWDSVVVCIHSICFSQKFWQVFGA